MLSIHNSSELIPQLEISDAVPSPSSSSDEHVLTKGQANTKKFSIRDYVFNSRSKDIKNSWPFSEKSLQICLNNGVKDLLPPFQSVNLMRNHYNGCLDEEDEVAVVNNDCHHQHEPPICSSSGIIDKPEKFLQPPPPPLPVKKCRVVNRLDSSSSKELVETTMNFADHAMISKICPVCKTFSSSSNTTLNAHIDRCLSTESSNDKLPLSDPKPPLTTSKNKIKPRKMRLMTDIYVTAKHCTLEELDRRNGRSWAVKPATVREEAIQKSHHKEEKLLASKAAAVQKDGNEDDGEVYIDASGTKVRILSKSDDKMVEGCVANKILVSKKKRLHHHRHHHMQKIQKYLKLDDPQSKKTSFSKSANNLEIARDPEMNLPSRRSGNVLEKPENTFKAQQQEKDRDFAPIRKWACAKRSSFFNRPGRKDDAPKKLALDCHSSDGPMKEKYVMNKRIRNSFETKTPFLSPQKRYDKVKQPLNRGDCQLSESVLDLHRASSEKSKKFSSLCSEEYNKEERITVVKKKRGVHSSNSREEAEGIHSPSPQTIGSLSITFPNSDFRKEGDPQTSLSNSLVNPLCLLEDNMSNDHDLYNASHEMGNPLILEPEDDHDQVLFHGVDPIPIPGPPGSFLPSPSPMDHMGGVDELHGNNSTLTNSIPESCENQYLDDHDDNRDSSNSPTSLASTISSRENFSKVNPSDATNVIVHPEKLNNQLCCCARKDQGHDPIRISQDLDIHDPDRESLKSLKLDTCLMKMFPINGECNVSSVSPTSPNPVLRLMGKNLMVNKEDDNLIQQQHYRPQWSSDSINPVQQQLSVSAITAHVRGYSFDHTAYQQAPTFSLTTEYNKLDSQTSDHFRSVGFGSYNFVNEPLFRKVAPFSAAAAAPAYHHDPMKEIIVIDDTPQLTGGGGNSLNRVRPTGVLIPMVPANNGNINSREKMIPFYRYHHHQMHHQMQNSILPTTTNGSFKLPTMMRLNNINSEGSSTMQTAPPSSSHPRGTAMLYYSRGFT